MENTTGLGSSENPPMMAIFTYHDPVGAENGVVDFQTQGIAFSTDKGRNWTKYEGNPVLSNPGIKDFRDPKVSWNIAASKWIMTLAVLDHIQFYSSPNLIDWTFESEFGKDIGDHEGVWECPDLFKLPVEGTDEEKWVLLVSINPGGPHGGSATQYFVGEFDGSKFILDESFTPVLKRSIWVDYGTDNYAGVTWSDIPKEDGRRIFLGWMSNWDYAQVVPTKKWRSAMTIPRTLGLRYEGENYILTSKPIKELASLRSGIKDIEPGIIESEQSLGSGYEHYELIVEIGLANSEGFELIFSNNEGQEVSLDLDRTTNLLSIDRRKSGVVDFNPEFAKDHKTPYMAGETVKLNILIDLASIEVFVDDGNMVLTEIFFADSGLGNINLVSKNGPVRLNSGTVSELTSIWDKN